jgi:two-component system chemotaxis response regulator CheY
MLIRHYDFLMLDKIFKFSPEDKFIVYDSKVIIYDPNNMSRALIHSALMETGFRQVEKFGDYLSAKEALDAGEYSAVVSSIDTENHDESKLIKDIRSNNKFDDSALVIVAEDITDNMAAKWISQGVDKFIPKPFTSLSLSKTIIDAIKSKFVPTDFMEKCKEAVALIEQNQLNDAKSILEESVKNEANPTEGYYLLGQIAIKQEKIEDAIIYFREGIKYNPLHLKSLLGFAFCAKTLGQKDVLYNTYYSILYLDPINRTAFTYVMKEGLSRNEMERIYETLYQYRFLSNLPDAIIDFIFKESELIVKRMLVKNMYDEVRLIYPLIKRVVSGDLDKYISVVNILSQHLLPELVSDALEEIGDNDKFKNIISVIRIRELFNAEDYGHAILECNRLINSGKPDDEIYELLIDSYLKLGKKDKAMVAYKDAKDVVKKASSFIDRYMGVFSN